MGRPRGGKGGEKNNKESQQTERTMQTSEEDSPPPLEVDSEEEATSRQSKRKREDSITKKDMQAMLVEMKKEFKDSITPIHQKLDAMNMSLTDLREKTDQALEQTAKNKQEIQNLKTFETWSKSKIILLDIKARERKIKLRGVSPSFATEKDLTGSLNGWLQALLQLPAALIIQAYRLKLSQAGSPTLIPDILAELTDIKIKNTVLEAARDNNGLKLEDTRIQVFQDLPPEILTARRNLKLITQRLAEKQIRYRWLPLGHLYINHKSRVFTVHDVKSGEEMLKALEL